MFASKPQNLLVFMFRFFRDFTPFSPYMAVYFSHTGLSLSRISLLFALWSFTSIALEIPTGVLADKYDRKTILILAQIAKLLGFGMWFMLPSFAGFLMGLILWGVAASLDSGTFQAFLFDLTQGDRSGRSFNTLYGQSNGASFAGLFAATLVASYVVRFGFNWLLLLSVIGLGLGLVAILVLPHPHAQRKSVELDPPFSYRTAVNAFYYIKSYRALLLLFAVGVAAAGIKAPLDEYHALFFEARGLPLFAIGLVLASFELVKSAGAFLAAKFSVRDSGQAYLLMGISILLVGAAFAPPYLAVGLLLVMLLVDMILWVSNDVAIQHGAQDANRATLASIKMFSGEVIAVAMLGIFTVTSKTFAVSAPSLYVLSGVLIGVIALLVFFAYPKSVFKPQGFD